MPRLLNPRIAGVSLSPDRDSVRALDPETRRRIYLRLAQAPLNPRQQSPFSFFGTADEWFQKSVAPPRAVELVRPLLYRHEGFQYFADLDSIRTEIEDPQDLRRLAKTLLRDRTLIAKLRIPDPSRIDAVVDYWGRGGRMTDIRPLLESAVAEGPEATIDIIHLLPHFARRHLYRYPKVTLEDLRKPNLANCFWTAMNFLSPEPYDDRFLDAGFTTAALKRDYYMVHDDFRLGDLVLFSDAEGRFYHAAVYIADGIVFGKNGSSALAPWTLLPLERIRGHFTEHLAKPGAISYYRRANL